MMTLARGLEQHVPCEVTFAGTVLGAPHFFYGTHSRAMHEEFQVRADEGRTVDVVDNVNIAPRIPVVGGDRVTLRGELVPDARGGPLVHWTHHDPQNRHAEGYIELNGKRYA